MLRHQPWITLAKEMMLEYEQCVMEGRDVKTYESTCREIAALASADSYADAKIEEAAEKLCEKMNSEPISSDFGFIEPSDLEGILAASPKNKPALSSIQSVDILKNKLAGAWYGRVAGCLLGKPVEGYRTERLYPLLRDTDNFPMRRYITKDSFTDEMIEKYRINVNACWADNIEGIFPVDDDTNYTVFALRLVKHYGKNFTSEDVLEAWLSWIPYLMTCTAERVAYRNAAMGILPPQTASYKNPYREWIGAQIRGDFFGYINPGDPSAAAEMAYRDASISHIKNGIYGEMFISAMIAAAAVSDDVRTVIETGLAYVPENSRLARDVKKVIALYDAGTSADEIISAIHSDYDEHTSHGWCYTNSNAMIVTMALLCGEKDFGKSLCLAVQSAFDTDCNGATVGSIIGMMIGKDRIPAYWTDPFCGMLKTSIDDYNTSHIDDLIDETLEILKK